MESPQNTTDDKDAFLAELKARFEALRAEGTFPDWD